MLALPRFWENRNTVVGWSHLKTPLPANHDGIDRQGLFDVLDPDLKSGVVYAEISNAAEHFDALGF